MRTPADVFDEFVKQDIADSMAADHWPRVQRAFERRRPPLGPYLELGAGTGTVLEAMASGPFSDERCVGLDVSAEMVRTAAARVARLDNASVEQADFLAWRPPGDLRFAFIFSMEVLYYFPDPAQAVAKAASLLAPGGQLWTLVDFYEENRASHKWRDELRTTMTLWSAAQYREAFERAGLAGVEQDRLHAPGAEDGPGTLLTVGTRPA